MDHLDYAKWRFSLEAEAPFSPARVIDDIVSQLITSGYRIIRQTATSVEFDNDGNHSYDHRSLHLKMLDGGIFEVSPLDNKSIIKLTYYIDMFFEALFVLLVLIVSLMITYLDSAGGFIVFLVVGMLVKTVFQIFWSKKIAWNLLLNF